MAKIYRYSKHTAKFGYHDFGKVFFSNPHYSSGTQYTGREVYAINPDTGVITYSGASVNGLSNESNHPVGTTLYYANNNGYGGRPSRVIKNQNSLDLVIWDYPTSSSKTYQKQDFIEMITAADGDYPVNGLHTDGFWYVREDYITTPPTVTLNTSNNQTLYENDSLSIAGNARDEDANQSVTVYYQINSETRRVLATDVSQKNIALLKQLIFKGGKFYDGQTPITGALTDGVAHKLKVWAVDDQGGQSTIIERDFYVVPNRAPLLSIATITPDGIINTDKFTISGNASDQDANSNVKVTRRINGGNAIEIYNGPGGAWEFDVSLAQLTVGQNTIIIEVIDNYGAKTSKTIKLNKNEVKTPILQSVARYKIEPPKGSAKGVLLWIQRDEDFADLKAELSMTLQGEQENYATLTATNTAPVDSVTVEDEFYFEAAEAKNNIILKLSTSRADININHKIHLISGVLE